MNGKNRPMTISAKRQLDRPMNGQILNGSGQGNRRFRLLNGQRCWIDPPHDEWQKFNVKPSYPNKTHEQLSL